MDLRIAGKTALVCASTAGLGLASARALADEGCRVVVTGRHAERAEQVAAEAQRAIPAGRYGRPEEFGAIVAFLAGTQASYITGSAIRCDGGMIAGL